MTNAHKVLGTTPALLLVGLLAATGCQQGGTSDFGPKTGVGAALGAAVLYLVFHHLGWAKLFAAYPDVVRSSAWSDATRWLSTHGVLALLVIAATPLPLTPALMFAGISRLPIVEVVLALWIGKLAKYLVYAWLASRFPERALRRGQRHADALRVIVARALSATPAQRHDATSSGELRR